MKIGHVISLPPFAWAAGGVPKAAFEVARAVAGQGHDVTMITTDMLERHRRYKSERNPETVDGVNIFRCHYISDWLAWDYKAFISPELILYVREHLKDFDIIHLHDLISPQGAATSIFCANRGMPYVLSPHGSLPWFIQPSLVKKIYTSTLGMGILNNASKISALNGMELQHCRQLGVPEEKVDIVPNGLNLEEFQNLPPKGGFRSRYEIGEDEQLLLFLGRIHQIKGLDLLLDSFSDSLEENGKLKLVIAGPDDGFQPVLVKKALRLGISERVLFPGPLYGGAKLQAYVDADVFVLPSNYEMFPLVLLEAVACGLPAIVTDQCGIAETVRGRFGEVVPVDRASLRNALLDLSSDDEKRRKYGNTGREVVREEFDWKKIAPKIVKLYQNALEA